MSNHPDKCRGCRGSDWQPGPPIVENIQGRDVAYPTLVPCRHEWHRDDTGYDPHYDDHLSERDPQAIAERERLVAIGQHDLWILSGGQLGARHPNHRTEGP